VGRRETNRATRLSLKDGAHGPQLEAEFDEAGGSMAEPDEVTAVLRQPGGATTEIALETVGPGRYAAPFPATDTGPYIVTLTARDRQSGSEDRIVRGMYWSADREHQARGADVQFLSRLASLTGGRLLRDTESPFDGPRPAGYRDVSMLASALALAMFVIDIATGFSKRRLDQWRQRASGQNRVAA